MSKFKVGDPVILLANKEEGWPEEKATVAQVESKGMLLVQVNKVGSVDDGMREVHESDVRKVAAKGKGKPQPKRQVKFVISIEATANEEDFGDCDQKDAISDLMTVTLPNGKQLFAEWDFIAIRKVRPRRKSKAKKVVGAKNKVSV